MNREINQLVKQNLIASEQKNELEKVANLFSVKITDEMSGLININDPNDPIKKQFVPSEAELFIAPEELKDPTGDHVHEPVRGIVHRYPDRVLLMPIHICPVYCRFCFRREDVSKLKPMSDSEIKIAINYIKTHPEIWEVILTGGDPLMLSPRRLKNILDHIDSIEHVKVIRLHSRVPIADPKRITDELCKVLKNAQKTIWLSIHTNHERELTNEFKQAVDRLNQGGVPMISQSVLLKGINDTVEALEALFRKLIEHKIKPYYLHHPDMAKGTSHFRLPIETGQTLMRQLHTQLSGIAKPTYIYDIPGGYGKMPLTPQYSNGEEVEDIHGTKHPIPTDK